MTFELDRIRCERAARRVEELAATLVPHRDVPFAADRLARALGSVPAESDDRARRAHHAAVAELHALAERIRGYAAATAAADEAGARAIEVIW